MKTTTTGEKRRSRDPGGFFAPWISGYDLRKPDESTRANEALESRLPGLATRISELRTLFNTVEAALKSLDGLKRHDELVGELPPAVSHLLRQPYQLARKEVHEALWHLKAAHGQIDGLLKGEKKDRYQEALLRQIHSNKALLSRFDELPEQAVGATTAYAVRKLSLNTLAKQCTIVEEFARELRNEGAGSDIDVLDELSSIESGVMALRRMFCRLRDNPSQRMSDQLRFCAGKLTALDQLSLACANQLKIRRLRREAWKIWSPLGVGLLMVPSGPSPFGPGGLGSTTEEAEAARVESARAALAQAA